MSELINLISPKYKTINELPYRQGVIGIVIDSKNQFLIVQMVSYGENEWRFPGGGCEDNETAKEALLRELKEELNSDKFEIVKESNQINRFNWPEEIIIEQIKKKNRYFRGQEQKQFLVRFNGAHEELRPDPTELRQIKWIPYNELESHFIFNNQCKSAESVIKELLPTISS